MKQKIRTMVTAMCIAATLLCATACGGGTSKEDAQKAQERERVHNLIKTESGFRNYLSGKTYVYDAEGAYGRTWHKITFLDEKQVILYEARTDKRNWGKGKRGVYRIEEEEDDYGRGIGEYYIWPETDENFNVPLITAPGCKLLDWDNYELTFTRRGQGGEKVATFRECDANYIPSQWR